MEIKSYKKGYYNKIIYLYVPAGCLCTIIRVAPKEKKWISIFNNMITCTNFDYDTLLKHDYNMRYRIIYKSV